jgi:hypothetical protein
VADSVDVSFRSVDHGELGRPAGTPGCAFGPVFRLVNDGEVLTIGLVGDADGSKADEYAATFSDADILLIHIGCLKDDPSPCGYKHLYYTGAERLLRALQANSDAKARTVLLSEFGLEMASAKVLDYYIAPLIYRRHHGKDFVDCLLHSEDTDKLNNILGVITLAHMFSTMADTPRSNRRDTVETWFAFDRICILFLARALQDRTAVTASCSQSTPKAAAFLAAAELIRARWPYYQANNFYPDCGYFGRCSLATQEDITRVDSHLNYALLLRACRAAEA